MIYEFVIIDKNLIAASVKIAAQSLAVANAMATVMAMAVGALALNVDDSISLDSNVDA